MFSEQKDTSANSLFNNLYIQSELFSHICPAIFNHSRSSKLLYMPAGSTLKKFYVLPTQRMYVFRMDLRTNSEYFPIWH